MNSSSLVKVSVMVTGFPPGFRRPEFLPGESPLQFTIRQHPRQWRNCIERLELTENQANALREGRHVVLTAEIRQELEAFQNLRLPSHGRTLKELAELRDALLLSPYQTISTFEITEVLWPRPSDSDPNNIARDLANELNVTIVQLPATASGPLDLTSLMKQVSGELWWILPGGTRLFTPTLVMQLQRVVAHMSTTQRCAMYADNQYSMIYRTSALRELVDKGVQLSADVRENARLLQLHGFQLSGGEAESPMCELESQFGGLSQNSSVERHWWQFWK